MVGVGREPLVHKQAIAIKPGLLLQWQGDQVSKATFGQGVLIWKQPVIGVQSDFRAEFHCLSQEEGAEVSGKPGWSRLFEEQPNVSAVARPGTLQGTRKRVVVTYPQDRLSITTPVVPVEIHCQKSAGFVQEHRINTHDEGAPSFIHSGEMAPDDFISDGQQFTVGTRRTLNTGFFTEPANPLVRTGR